MNRSGLNIGPRMDWRAMCTPGGFAAGKCQQWYRDINGRRFWFSVCHWTDGEIAWQVTTAPLPLDDDGWLHDIRFNEPDRYHPVGCGCDNPYCKLLDEETETL